MFEQRRIIGRVILVILLATVSSPGFGWDLVAGESDHDHVAFVADGDHLQRGHGDEHDHGLHHAGHDRVGHMLSHMPATVSLLDVNTPPAPGGDWDPAILPVFLREVSNRVLRPPRRFPARVAFRSN